MEPTIDHTTIPALVAQGDQAAFTQLFLRYRDLVYTTAYRVTESAVEAEEIVQDVFMKVWAIREELPAIINLEAYIFTIARNYTFNALKRLLRERERTGLWPSDGGLPAISPEAAANAAEFMRVLQQAIEQLPPQQKQVYLLIREEELTKAQVAEKMGISPNTVKSHFDAAVRAVRSYCAPYRKLSTFFFLLF
ncbi:RNA polymerase sigma factor [Chitinophaga qingshengii]|uniref:RNA polymerase sigma factor n=1 Tax=Chitinophaga qingshengii TaxID=1569794 RepID=A0ABR7TK64_9BACT|nr:sigma-70 family RNA polymerase sigma factor [Chitinophaga qingshengii]MBC9930055.1 sigma-70 family RNA polymerase sigma factor [Chitinophaga qingshengii]